MINGNPVNNGSLIHTQTHTHIHIYNLMLNAQNNMIIHVIVFLVINVNDFFSNFILNNININKQILKTHVIKYLTSRMKNK